MSNSYHWRRIEKQQKDIRGVWLQLNTNWFDANMNRKLDSIQEWCVEHKCGRRMSYDMWQFNTEEQVTMFLLKWS